MIKLYFGEQKEVAGNQIQRAEGLRAMTLLLWVRNNCISNMFARLRMSQLYSELTVRPRATNSQLVKTWYQRKPQTCSWSVGPDALIGLVGYWLFHYENYLMSGSYLLTQLSSLVTILDMWFESSQACCSQSEYHKYAVSAVTETQVTQVLMLISLCIEIFAHTSNCLHLLNAHYWVATGTIGEVLNCTMYISQCSLLTAETSLFSIRMNTCNWM